MRTHPRLFLQLGALDGVLACELVERAVHHEVEEETTSGVIAQTALQVHGPE